MTDRQPDWYGLRTRPLTLAELAVWFDSSERRVSQYVKGLEGTMKQANRFRIRLQWMPPEFLVAIGVIGDEAEHDPDALGHLRQVDSEVDTLRP